MSLATRIAQEINSVRSEVVQAPSPAQPFSGYSEFNEIENNFVFKEDANFLASIADKNQYVKFGDKVIDVAKGASNINFNNSASFQYNSAYWDFRDNRIYRIGLATTASSLLASDKIIHTEGTIFRVRIKVSKVVNNMFQFLGTDIFNIFPEDNCVKQNNYIKPVDASKDCTALIKLTTDSEIGIAFMYASASDDSLYIEKLEYEIVQTYDGAQHIPEVIVQDQATDGLNVQQSVSQGEFVVVDREELVTNGTFDSDTSGWSSGFSYDNGTAFLSELSIGEQSLSFIDGMEYVVRFKLTNNTVNTSVRIRNSLGGYTYQDVYPDGEHVFSFIASSSISLLFYSSASGRTGNVDNISVKQVDETYRAIQDAPSGTALTDTSYFELNDDRPLTNPVLVAHTMNDLTKSYEGLTGEVLFNDPVAGESTKEIMTKNGYSVVSEGLYSKGAKLYVPARIALC